MEPASLPDIVNEEEEYKVEEIRKHWKWGQETQFLVHWKGYRNEYDQWIAETGLPYAKEAIDDYWTRILKLKSIKEEGKILNWQAIDNLNIEILNSSTIHHYFYLT